MNDIKELFKKYKEMVLYVVFGVLTTAVNYASYFAFSRLLNVYGANNQILNYPGFLFSNTAAWVLSVAFAYITNKLFVFESRSWNPSVVCKEAAGFVGARALSLLIDLIILWIGTDLLKYNDLIVKIISNVIVIIFNYVASKMFIFKNKAKD